MIDASRDDIHCHRCGTPITPEEVAAGLAVKLNDELLCPSCVDVLPPATKVRINRLRALYGLDVTTYRVIDPDLPGLELYTFTNTANIILHRRALRADGRYEAPVLGSPGTPPARASLPLARFRLLRLPKRIRAALFAAGVLVGIALALAVFAPRGAAPPPAPDADPAEVARRERVEAQRTTYRALEPLAAWRTAQRAGDVEPEVLREIRQRIVRLKERDLADAEAAFSAPQPHLTRTRECLDRTELPFDFVAEDLRQRERRLRDRLGQVLAMGARPPPDGPADDPPDPPDVPPGEELRLARLAAQRQRYEALPPLEAWRTATAAGDVDPAVLTAIRDRLLARKTAELTEAEALLDAEPPAPAEAEPWLARTPMPDDAVFAEIRHRERRLRERLEALRTPPPPSPPDPAELQVFANTGAQVLEYGPAGWRRKGDGIEPTTGEAGSLALRLRLPAGRWTLWVQGRCPDGTATLHAVVDGARLETEQPIPPKRSGWLRLAPELAFTEDAEHRLALFVTGGGWFIKRLVLADPRLAAPTGADLEGRPWIRWLPPEAPPPPPAPLRGLDLPTGGRLLRQGLALNRLDERAAVRKQGEILAAVGAGSPLAVLRSERMRHDGAEVQGVDLGWDRAVDLGGGGLLLLLHPNRERGRTVRVALFDRLGRRWDGPAFDLAEDAWQVVAIDCAGIPVPQPDDKVIAFDTRRVDHLMVFDPAAGNIFPFYLGRVAVRAGSPPAADELAVPPPVLGNADSRTLASLMRIVGSSRGWTLATALKRLDPARVKFLVGDQLNAGWRTRLRQELAPHLGVADSGDLPRGLVEPMVFQDSWLDETFIREQLRSREHHVVVVMTAGMEFQVGLTKGQALMNFWDKMAVEAKRSGFVPLVVLGPSKVDEGRKPMAEALWDELEAHLRRHHPSLPILDLRSVTALDARRFAPGMGERCARLLTAGYRELGLRLEQLRQKLGR